MRQDSKILADICEHSVRVGERLMPTRKRRRGTFLSSSSEDKETPGTNPSK